MCLQTIFALFLAIFARNNRSQSENLYTIVLLYIKNYRQHPQHPRKRFFSKFILIPIKALAKFEAEITLTGQVLLQRTLIVFVVE